jgi:hypothetical protein
MDVSLTRAETELKFVCCRPEFVEIYVKINMSHIGLTDHKISGTVFLYVSVGCCMSLPFHNCIIQQCN